MFWANYEEKLTPPKFDKMFVMSSSGKKTKQKTAVWNIIDPGE